MATKKAKTKSQVLKEKQTQMRETFCLRYFQTGKKGQSARDAGFSKHAESANQLATRLLKEPRVIKRLAELQKAAESAAIADVVERKKVLTEIVRGRVSQYTDGNRISVKAGELNSAAVAEVTTSEVKFGRGDDALTAEITKLKLRDPVPAIDLLNKMDKIYAPEGTGTVNNLNINIDKVLVDARGKLESIINSIAARTGTGEGNTKP
ncbi:MAG: terminase small subunit [Sphaerochaeta sp.]|jgi:phage terminase small subunit|nr:terminase small subunit [Sphaerochaeta sp.]